MITIRDEKCTRCGTCAEICHERCITVTGQGLHVDHRLCSTCTQCIAVCPHQALGWDGADPIPFEPSRLPGPAQLDELLRERRTTRHFRREKIDRALLKEIVAYGICAPTNNYGLRAILLDDSRVMAEIEELGVQTLARVYSIFYRHALVFNALRRLTSALDAKDKVKLEACLRERRIFSGPAALVFVVGDRRISHSEASAQYYLYNMALYAQVNGIGACVSGGGLLLLNNSRAARARLGLAGQERMLGILQLGFPAVKFRNKVQGKVLPMQWIES